MIYLDNAATSFPKPSSVYESVMKAMKVYGANPGRGSHAMAIEGASIHTSAALNTLILIDYMNFPYLAFNCSCGTYSCTLGTSFTIHGYYIFQ
jgi:cysteine desulfurase/selenocysteine lyase